MNLLNFIDIKAVNIIVFSLILTVFGLIPAYFYIKNYYKNMQKYKEEQAIKKVKGLSKYIKFIILINIILVIFTIFIGYNLNKDLEFYIIAPIVFIIFVATLDLKIILHFILIFYLFILWNDKLIFEFISKVF